MNTKADWLAAKVEFDAIEAERNELLKPTNERYCSAQERIEEIEDACDGLLGVCEGCSNPIWEGEKVYSYDDGPMMCEACAPTYADMLADREGWFSYDADGEQVPMTAEKAKEICDAHIAAGGALNDSMAEA